MASQLTSSPTGGHVVAFMDIGTNSVRMSLVRIDADNTYYVLTEEREQVRLGDREFKGYEIRPEAIARVTLVITRFAEMARSFGAQQIIALATAATREASNQRQLLQAIHEVSGVDVHAISGREEARLIYLGVASGARLDDGNVLFLDIGGGSTEIIVGDQRNHHYLDSLRLGAIRLTNLFFKHDDPRPVGKGKYGRIQKHVRTSAVRAIQRLRGYRYNRIVGSSGTIVALADVAARRFFGRPFEDHDVFSHRQFKQVIAELASMNLEQRCKVPGLSAKRADIIIAGAAIFDTLLEDLGDKPILVSERSLRDGLLIDYLLRGGHAGPVRDMSFRMHSALRLGRLFRFDEEHARHMAKLSLELFDSARAAGLHDYGEWERELLEYAALLHDIGTFLAYSNHRHHSYYLIRNAELLGFDDKEVAIIATTALFHKKTYPRKKKHPQFAALDKPSRKIVRVLCVMLRIAESLDRSHAGAARHARLMPLDEQNVALELDTSGDCHLEMWAVQVHAKAFERCFKRKLHVRAATEQAPAIASPAVAQPRRESV